MVATKRRYTLGDLLERDPGDETLYEILGGELVQRLWSGRSSYYVPVVH